MECNCHHFVPLFQGKWTASEAVGWLQSYCGFAVSLFFLSWAWGRSLGPDDLSTIVSFFSLHGHGHFDSPLSSLFQEMHGSGCGAVALSQTQWAFLHVITLFYTLLLLVLLLLVLVFLISLMVIFSKFLFQPVISTFIPPSLVQKESSCLEFNFQLVSNHNIQK